MSFSGLTDDIVIYDNGSTDNTREVVEKFPVHYFRGPWKGFGPTKNEADDLARYDWILSLDADEAIDEELKRNLLALNLGDEKTVYKLKFRNFLGDKWIRHGEWGNDTHIRLFNRKTVRWNDATVHEKLILPPGCRIKTLNGYVLHRTVNSVEEYRNKMNSYAMMNAENYFRGGKKYSSLKKYISPAFSFLNNYIFRLGFLDGKEGLICARMTASYTFRKYKLLEEFNRSGKTRI